MLVIRCARDESFRLHVLNWSESWAGNFDTSGNSAENSPGVVGRKDVIEGVIRGKYFPCLGGNVGAFESAVDGPRIVPVREMNEGCAGKMSEGHVVEDDSVVVTGSEFSEFVHVADEKWSFKQMEGVLGLTSAGRSPDVETFPAWRDVDCPAGWVVLERDVRHSVDVVSKHGDVSD